ncbi:hypothetical protein MMC17_008401, partial [Xylographa soralifera]|nr:hypothetical protein [Xylographa soralifera]
KIKEWEEEAVTMLSEAFPNANHKKCKIYVALLRHSVAKFNCIRQLAKRRSESTRTDNHELTDITALKKDIEVRDAKAEERADSLMLEVRHLKGNITWLKEKTTQLGEKVVKLCDQARCINLLIGPALRVPFHTVV